MTTGNQLIKLGTYLLKERILSHAFITVLAKKIPHTCVTKSSGLCEACNFLEEVNKEAERLGFNDAETKVKKVFEEKGIDPEEIRI